MKLMPANSLLTRTWPSFISGTGKSFSTSSASAGPVSRNTAAFIVAGTLDMCRRPAPKLPARLDMNLTPLEVSSLPRGDSGLIGGLNG